MEQKIRTDLALETREKFMEEHVTVPGVYVTERQTDDGRMHISMVEIRHQAASEKMEKPMGHYVTIEIHDIVHTSEEEREKIIEETGLELRKMIHHRKSKRVLAVGLGNREVTPDSLGPLVTDRLFITRHLLKEFGDSFLSLGENEERESIYLSAVAPGVMAQTGMEAVEIVRAIAEQTQIDLVLVVDALAARSIARVNSTIQLTDTGICPGSGIGNHRNAINEQSIGCPVIAIGVPTVVNADTIVKDCMRLLMKQKGTKHEQMEGWFQKLDAGNMMETMFVTPKSIDEEVRLMSDLVAGAINECFFSNAGEGAKNEKTMEP